MSQPCPPLRVSQAEIKVWQGCAPYRKLRGIVFPSGFWQDSVPCGCGMRFPFPCWLSSKSLSQFLKIPSFLIALSLHLQTSKGESSPSHLCHVSSASHFLASHWLQLENVCHFNGLVWLDWAYLHNPGHSPHPRSISLIVSENSTFPWIVTFTGSEY